MATAAKPHLLGLPAELRNHIYRYVLSGETIEVDRKNIRQRTSLLHTSRQLRKEAIGIFFAENHFRVQVTINNYPLLIQWIENLGPHAQCIVHLDVLPKYTSEFKTTLQTLVESCGPTPTLEDTRKTISALRREWTSLLHKWQPVLIELAKSLVSAGVSLEAIQEFQPAVPKSNAIIQQALVGYLKDQTERIKSGRGDNVEGDELLDFVVATLKKYNITYMCALLGTRI